MKVLIAILLLLIGVFVFTQLVGLYDRTANSGHASNSAPERTEASSAGGASLPGLPSFLEASLAEAQQQGAEGLGKWLKTWGKKVQDPRLASIELDYVVLLNLKDHNAARERFQEVKARTSPASPVYERIKKLELAYAQ